MGVQFPTILSGDEIKMVSNNECVKNYFEAGVRDRYNKACNMYFEGDTLCSYGSHFILAIKTKQGNYLLNGDTYSVTTSGHQSHVRSHAPTNSPIIPFSALYAMIEQRTKKLKGYYDRDKELKKINILDITKDTWTTETGTDKEGNPYEVQVHHLGASLIKYRNKTYISSIDITGKAYNTFFIVQLKNNVDTVEQAYRELAGNLTDQQYKDYQEGVIQRQGEYFFIPITDKTNDLLFLSKQKKVKCDVDLSKGQGNAHTAKDYIKTVSGIIYVKRSIRHDEHKMVSLKNIWNQVIKNTAKQSWSASGNVD
jgi:hypothetical protein